MALVRKYVNQSVPCIRRRQTRTRNRTIVTRTSHQRSTIRCTHSQLEPTSDPRSGPFRIHQVNTRSCHWQRVPPSMSSVPSRVPSSSEFRFDEVTCVSRTGRNNRFIDYTHRVCNAHSLSHTTNERTRQRAHPAVYQDLENKRPSQENKSLQLSVAIS